MATIPIDQAVTRLTENEERFDDFITSASGVYTTRLGGSVPVLQQVIAGLQAGALLYANTTDGLAATPNQGYFYVVQAAPNQNILDLYRDNAGVAVYINSYPSLQAITAALSSALSIVLQAFDPKPNLFNLTTTTGSLLIQISDGAAIASPASCFVTDFIPVVAGSQVTATLQPGSSPATGLAFYTAGKTFVSGSGSRPAANSPVTVPATAVYVRYGFVDGAGTLRTGLQIVPASTVNTLHKTFGVVDPFTSLQAARTVTRQQSGANVNIFDRRAITTGRYYDNNTQAFVSFAGSVTSDYMPVTGGGKIIWTETAGGFGGFGVSFFDINKTYCGGISFAPTSGVAYDVPPAAAYAILAMGPGANILDRQAVFAAAALPTIAQVGHGTDWSEQSRIWRGKRFGVIGDSISTDTGLSLVTQNEVWKNVVCNYLHTRFIFNDGVSSRTMSNALDVIDSTIANNLDLLVIFLGTNDYALNTTFGAITDSIAATTFYGYTRKTIEQIMTWNPALRLVFIGPIGGVRAFNGSGVVPTNGQGKSLYDYSDALEAVCRVYAIPFLDQLRTCGINFKNSSTYIADGIHPNALGHGNAIARPVGKWLESL